MIILGIETSCDETALSIVNAKGEIGDTKSLAFEVYADEVMSQIAIHKQYGGVFPIIAKREHGLALVPLLKVVLQKAGMLKDKDRILNNDLRIKKENNINTNAGLDSHFHGNDNTGKNDTLEEKIRAILSRENNLGEELVVFLQTIKKPKIDAIAVTRGPGLEPALWVGISFAKALSLAWGIPVIPTNHMEGHIVSALSNHLKMPVLNAPVATKNAPEMSFPALALLVSGGHTELVLVKGWTDYEIVGKTLDDAVGEAFDKVARMLDLPYPGGPEISKLAESERKISPTVSRLEVKFPRPMIHSKDFNFSFSGLKTSVLYFIKKLEKLDDEMKAKIAREFEDTVVEVLMYKTKKVQEEVGAESIIVGGGVSANKEIRKAFENWTEENNLKLFIPSAKLSTDNALMIAMAGYIRYKSGKIENINDLDFRAQGNLNLEE